MLRQLLDRVNRFFQTIPEQCSALWPGSELLFEVVSRAYEQQSLIVTTNLPFDQWVEVCGSERLTGALLDRLTHRVHIIEANGESYRLQDSQRRLRRRKKAQGPGRRCPAVPGSAALRPPQPDSGPKQSQAQPLR